MNEDGTDCGGNRPYDYISLEEHHAARATLENKDRWEDLNQNEIVVLRSEARSLGLDKDVVDHIDRLALLRCLFHHCDNRDMWMKTARESMTPTCNKELDL